LPALVHAVALAANAGGTADQVTQIALEQVAELTGWRSGRALAAETGWLSRQGAPTVGRGGVVSRLRARAGALAAAGGVPLAVRLVAGPDAAWCRPSPPDGAAPEGRHLGLVVGVPVLVGDELVAVLEFLHDDPSDAPDDAMLAALSSIGVQLAHVIGRERDRQALLAAVAHERAVIDHAGDAYVETDPAGSITAWNPKAEQMFGWRALEVLGRPVGQVLVPARLRPAHERGIEKALARGSSHLDGQVVRLPALHRDGHEVPVELSLSLRPGPDGAYVQAFLRDVAERERTEREIRRQRDLLDTVLDSLTDGVVACDAEGRLSLVSRSYLDRWGLPDDPRPPQEWLRDLQLLASDGVTPVPIERSPLFRALAGESVASEELVIGRPGDLRRFRCTAQPLLTDEGARRGAVCVLHDITEQVAAQRSLTEVERTDRVSGLPNAAVLLDALAELPAHGRYTLVQVHLEDLPVTVAGEGVSAGDDLVCAVGARLRSVVRDVDLVTHSGAERFAVLLRHDARTDPRHLAERVLDAVAVHEEPGGATRRLRLSAGLAAVDRAAPQQSVSHSELALQTARTSAAGRLEVFAPAMAEQLKARTALRRDLERAISEDQLTLRYQPQFDLSTGRIRGVEALVRWQHPVQGLVRPDEFIPLAEETGLVLPLGRWVLTQTCRQAVRWTAAGLPPVRVSVNVSGRQLVESFPDEVAAVLAATGLPADRLELEMTETVAVANAPMVSGVLNELRSLGVRLAIDDFGTGYSMLGRLRSLPFTQLKIDRSFVDEIAGQGSAPLVRAMLAMADGLGLDVVAEGVETPDQLAFLRDHGCPAAQGYLLARPVDADEVAALLVLPGPPRPFLDLADPRPVRATPTDVVDLHALLAEIERLTGFESVYLTRVRDGEQQVVAVRNTADLVVADGGRWPWDTSLCATALRDGSTAMSDVDVRYGDNLHVLELGLASYLGVPILGADGDAVGTLCAASTSRIDVPAETLAVVQVYAGLVAQQLLADGEVGQQAAATSTADPGRSVGRADADGDRHDRRAPHHRHGSRPTLRGTSTEGV
ncbi:MAG TPA: EAL domain-containing protein, partial [Mycobacteriales bacterium]|nr:EAL domain-containing protein [Mycobacteriales bacterium]